MERLTRKFNAMQWELEKLSEKKDFRGRNQKLTGKEFEDIRGKQKEFMEEIQRFFPALAIKFQTILWEISRAQDENNLDYKTMRNVTEFLREVIIMKIDLNRLQAWDLGWLKETPEEFAERLELTKPFFD